MQITLSEQARVWAEQQVTRAGYKSLDAYLETLILRDQREAGWLDELVDARLSSGKDIPQDRAHVRQALQERVVALLDEAVASGPAAPMTAQDWEDIRREVRERRQRPEGQ
jgi:hypothetical protein